MLNTINIFKNLLYKLNDLKENILRKVEKNIFKKNFKLIYK